MHHRRVVLLDRRERLPHLRMQRQVRGVGVGVRLPDTLERVEGLDVAELAREALAKEGSLGSGGEEERRRGASSRQ